MSIKTFIARIFDKTKSMALTELEKQLELVQEEIKTKKNEIKEKESIIVEKSNYILTKESQIKNKEIELEQKKKEVIKIESRIHDLEELESLTLKIDKQKKEELRYQNQLIELEKKLKRFEEQYENALEEGPEIPSAYGLYEPKYNLTNSTLYKERLEAVRDGQKEAIKNKQALVVNGNWTVDGSKREGNKLVNRVRKMALRAFNGECEAIIASVKYYSKYSARKDRILKSYESINEMVSILNMGISNYYLTLKYQELDLVFDYEVKLRDERQALAKQREIEKDEELAKKEYEREMKRILKEQTHFQNEMSKIRAELLKSTEKEREKYERKISELTKKIERLEEEKQTFTRLFENKAGYVYIISNIGAFGEDVYKIGTTRRLNPYERIDELCNASVPFRFDAHALIFSENCYERERDLHRFFEKNRLNKTNRYKEFFKIPIDEIEKYVLSKDPTVKFIKMPEAIEYQLSLKMTEESNKVS